MFCSLPSYLCVLCCALTQGYVGDNNLEESALDQLPGVLWPTDGMHRVNDLSLAQVLEYLEMVNALYSMNTSFAPTRRGVPDHSLAHVSSQLEYLIDI